MRYPKKLPEGGTIGIAAPSSPKKTERMMLCKETLEKMGYKVKLAENIDHFYMGYIAGPGKERAQELNKMFADPEIDGIICICGGDGSGRIMKYLDYDLIKRNPKVFVGYSDVTHVNVALNQNCDLVTFHGPMVSSNMVEYFDDETRESFFAAVCADDGVLEFKNPKGKEIETIHGGFCQGEIIGGNLSLLSAGIGTPYEMNTKGKVVFIEEVKEKVSKIEKWMWHLKNAGKFDDCAGIVLGQFTNINMEECPDLNVFEYIAEILSDIDVPIVYGVESGHGKPMMTIPLGAACQLDADNKTLKFIVER